MDIPRVTRTLLAHQNKTHTALAEHMHIGPSLLSKKLSGLRGWSADDVAAMADFFDVEPELFFRDPEQLIRQRSATGDTGERNGDVTLRSLRGIGTDNARWRVPIAA